MSDSPAFVPHFVNPSLRPDFPRRAAAPDGPGDPDMVETDEDVEGGDDASIEPPAAREGLPAHYRMRAEPHYVEALAGAAAAARVSGEPMETRGDTPGTSGRADRALAAAASELAQSVEAIRSAVAQLPTAGRPLRDRMAIELARAEAVRAGWLAEAVRVLQSEPLPTLDQVDLGAVLGTVAEALGPEHRITGVSPVILPPDVAAPVFADARLLTVAVGGLLHAMRALVEPHGATSRVLAQLAPRTSGATRALEVVQTAVRLPMAAEARLFDAEWVDHPAGPTGAVLLAAARRIALAQGGNLEVVAVDGGGSRLVLSLPAAG